MREDLLAGLAFLLLGVASPAVTEEAPGPSSAARVPPTRADLDLHEIRNIFRYGDDPEPGPAESPGPAVERDAVVDDTTSGLGHAIRGNTVGWPVEGRTTSAQHDGPKRRRLDAA